MMQTLLRFPNKYYNTHTLENPGERLRPQMIRLFSSLMSAFEASHSPTRVVEFSFSDSYSGFIVVP